MSAPVPPTLVADQNALDDARPRVRAALARQVASLPAGMPRPALLGRLYRPLAALAGCDHPQGPWEDDAFWSGALAIQMAHEASLIHDDIVDRARTRRGEPSLASQAGVPRALIAGDHLLTAAYRCAARTESPLFVREFARAVERTVWGELRQAAEHPTTPGAPLEIAALKTGELFSMATGLAAMLREDGTWRGRVQWGRHLGRFYQMVDDFLDFCPSTRRGKDPLADYAGGLRTWVMVATGTESFSQSSTELLDHLFRPDPGKGGLGPMGRALQVLCVEADALLHSIPSGASGDRLGPALVRVWLGQARQGFHGEWSRRTRDTAPRSHPAA